jgi:subtilase family serine protease
MAALAATAVSPALAAGQGRHVLAGAKPAWVGAVKKTADVPSGQKVSAKVWLAPRNAAQLDALARAVSDPTNSQYGQIISEDQYRAQFAPTADQVTAVRQWLTGAGLHVDSVGPDSHFVAVSGSAASVSAAFGTGLGTYRVNGKQVRAPYGDVSVPGALGASVLTVTGLSTLGHVTKPADLGAPDAFVNGTPCSDYYGQKVATTLPKFQGKTLPYAVCGYVPSQLRGAYGIDQTRSDGSGQTVAITDAYDARTLLADANKYSGLHGDRPFDRNQFADKSVREDASTAAACGGNGWYGEQALDIEAVHAMAPGAKVLYYGAASCYDDDLLASLSRAVADNKASIVTNSWGEPTFVVIDGVTYAVIDQGLVDAYEAVFKQGAVQGIGFYFSSGDNGDDLAAWGFLHPDWPTEDPWVTSVGGTSLAIDAHNNRMFETGWGTQKYTLSANGKSWTPIAADPFLYGAGGGYSQIFDRPWYQNGIVPQNTSGRAVPDVGMDADPTTGMLVGETQGFSLPSRFGPAGVRYGEYRIGGTSLASPLFAGAQAVAQSAARQRFGFANPLIYWRAGQRAGNGGLFDVTPTRDNLGNVRADYANGINAANGVIYSTRTFDHDSSLFTARGWDDVTGIGSVTSRYITGIALPH